VGAAQARRTAKQAEHCTVGAAQARRTAKQAEHCTVGATPIKCTGNRTEGSNPSLSADISEFFSLLQPVAASALPTGCTKLSRPIASHSSLGARCMYRRVMLSVECPTSS
jgi:hypothetical protein